QFLRFAEPIKAQGATVILECHPELVRLCKSCASVDYVVAAGKPLPRLDVQASLMSLPAILKTTLATLPASIPYIHCDPDVVEHWRQRLGSYRELKVGIFWQGNPWLHRVEFAHMDRLRSAPFDHFERLSRIPSVRLFSLQKGRGTEGLEARMAA